MNLVLTDRMGHVYEAIDLCHFNRPTQVFPDGPLPVTEAQGYPELATKVAAGAT